MSDITTLRPLGRGDFGIVSEIDVAPEQLKFSGSVSEAFEADEDDVDFHAIFHDGQAVGFFKIDRHYCQTITLAGPGDLGLRAFLIDVKAQGKGIATSAVRALRPYLRKTYPGAPAVMLTVNKVNPAAIACYLKGGFVDTGQTWLKGEAGPQHVMRMALTK